jgi:diguanylate cyclase (GGDEF)-like protein
MKRWRGLPVALTLVLGIGASLGAYVRTASWTRHLATIDFESRAEAQTTVINTDLQDAGLVLETLRGYFEANDQPVSGSEFARFSRVLHNGVAGLQYAGWAPRVIDRERAEFEARMRAAGFPDFEIRELDGVGKPVRAGVRPDYFPVVYLEAGNANRPVMGIDIGFEATRRATINRAIASGHPSATPPMTLLTVRRPRGGVLAYMPVYRTLASGEVLAPDGLAFGAFDIDAMVENIIAEKRRITGIDTYFFDPARPVGDRLIYWRSGSREQRPAPGEASLRALPHWEGTVAMMDQPWGVLVLPSGGLADGYWTASALATLILGLLLTGLVSSFLLVLLRRNTRLEMLTTSLHETSADLRQQSERIVHMARNDALTNLPNRPAFHEALRSAAARAERGENFAVLALDLDRFKQVNDTLGHPVGDALLRAVAGRLDALVRLADTVARLGGDEFSVVQTDIPSPDAAAVLATRIIESLREPYDVAGHRVVIGATVGIALGDVDDHDPDTLMRSADLALYRAKQEGRGVFRFFEPEMDARAQARRQLEVELRHAIEHEQFEVYYQPLISVADRRIAAFEALIRWNSPTKGLVPPNEFIPLAEEIGLIVPIGGWVLRNACAQAAQWPESVGVAVNLSAVQFTRGDVVAQVRVALRESGLAPTRLELEITETTLLTDSTTTLAALHALHELGVRIAMDDFGTGYSSLSYLRSFPFDRLKIDRSFVRELGETTESAAIVRAIASMGLSLGIATTAEGVENEAQMRQLMQDGCTELQGYFFGKPCPAHEATRLLSVVPANSAAA